MEKISKFDEWSFEFGEDIATKKIQKRNRKMHDRALQYDEYCADIHSMFFDNQELLKKMIIKNKNTKTGDFTGVPDDIEDLITWVFDDPFTGARRYKKHNKLVVSKLKKLKIINN